MHYNPNSKREDLKVPTKKLRKTSGEFLAWIVSTRSRSTPIAGLKAIFMRTSKKVLPFTNRAITIGLKSTLTAAKLLLHRKGGASAGFAKASGCE